MRYLVFTLLTAGLFLALSDPSYAQNVGTDFYSFWKSVSGGGAVAGGGGGSGNTTSVPLPETLALFGAGFAGFAAWRIRKGSSR
jgi:hypothetical protein